MKEKIDKSKQLEDKINLLVEKIENEDGKFKRLSYIVRCKMLVAKLQRQIDLQNAKEDFKKAKEENKITAKEEKANARSKIIELNKKIKKIEKEINANSEYDIETSKFIFPKEEVQQSGGIRKYARELYNSGRPEQIETAEKIQESLERRKELKKLKEELEEQKTVLNNVDKALKEKNKKITNQETALVLKGKFNIFAGIRRFANSITSSVKEFWAETKENKEIENQRKETLEELQTMYDKEKEKITKAYEQKMKELEENRDKLEAIARSTYDEKKNEKAKSNRSERALKFQEEMQKLASPIDKNDENIEKDENEKNTDEDEMKHDRMQDVKEIMEQEENMQKYRESSERVASTFKKRNQRNSKNARWENGDVVIEEKEDVVIEEKEDNDVLRGEVEDIEEESAIEY